MLRRGLSAVAAVAAVAAVGAAPASSAASEAERARSAAVSVQDDFFKPNDLRIKVGTKVQFKWDRANTNSHNVTLRKGPRGVKKGCPTKGKDAYSPLISKCNKSSTGAVGIKFTKKFDKAGTYDFLCTIHPDVMKIEIEVKK